MKPHITITYCTTCGYEQPTLQIASALMEALGDLLGAISIKPAEGEGAFDVWINGELVHSMYREGGFPAPEAIVAATRARLSEQ